MNRLVILLSSLLVLSACASPEPRIVYRTITVEKPVYTAPEFEIPKKPILPTDLLSEEDMGDHNKIGNAYVSTKKILELYAQELLNLLETIKQESISN